MITKKKEIMFTTLASVERVASVSRVVVWTMCIYMADIPSPGSTVPSFTHGILSFRKKLHPASDVIIPANPEVVNKASSEDRKLQGSKSLLFWNCFKPSKNIDYIIA